MIYACPYCEGEMLRQNPKAVVQVCISCRRKIEENRINAMLNGYLPVNGELPPLMPLDLSR